MPNVRGAAIQGPSTTLKAFDNILYYGPHLQQEQWTYDYSHFQFEEYSDEMENVREETKRDRNMFLSAVFGAMKLYKKPIRRLHICDSFDLCPCFPMTKYLIAPPVDSSKRTLSFHGLRVLHLNLTGFDEYYNFPTRKEGLLPFLNAMTGLHFLAVSIAFSDCEPGEHLSKFYQEMWTHVNLPSLKRLEYSGVDGKSYSQGEMLGQSFTKFLERHLTLEKLVLDTVDTICQSWRPLFDVMRNHPALKKFDFSNLGHWYDFKVDHGRLRESSALSSKARRYKREFAAYIDGTGQWTESLEEMWFYE